MAARKNAAPKRTDDDRTADKAAATSIVTDLRTARDDLRTALKALPAPASRTAAQKRDALLLRSQIMVIRSQLLGWGVGTAADRDGSDV